MLNKNRIEAIIIIKKIRKLIIKIRIIKNKS
jgi:hypothetical protein